MANIRRTSNNSEVLSAISDVTGKFEYLTSHLGVLNTTAGGGGGGGAVTIADGASITEGAIADAKVVGDNPGTVSAKLRGINTALAGTLTASISNFPATQPVSGTITANIGTTGNLISTNNSTTTPLAGGAAFTGTADVVSGYANARITVFADQVSATNGLSIQQSTNGTNWDFVDAYTISASSGAAYDVPIYASQLRVVYTNGATLQGAFRLQVVYHNFRTKPSSVRPQDARSNENDMEEDLAYLMGYNGTTWDRIRTKGTGVVSSDTTTINNVTPLMGNGVTGTGSQRVTVASDNTPFPVKIDQTTPGTTNLVALAANQSVNNAQIGGVAVSTGVGVTGTGVQRVVEASGAGRTLVSAGGSVASSGNNTLVAAGTNRLKVYGFSLTTTSTTAVTCIFQSGAGGTELWRVILQAPTSVNVGANLIVTPPAWIFATASATLLNLNLSGAQTVHWSVAYYDEI